MSSIRPKKTILIMAGGTGGHIFPALAINKALKTHPVHVEWLGSPNGMETTLVPKHGIKLHTISTLGLRGKPIISLLKAPFLLSLAFFQAIKLFVRIKPDVVLGMGGFATGIGGVVAWLFRIPLVIHEQNAIAGTTNKLLSKIASQVFQAVAGTFNNAITCGNPVLFSPANPPHKDGRLNLLIIGGSLGSKPINEVATQLKLDINIWHQTGLANLARVKAQYANSTVKLSAFIEDMAAAYAWADMVLCRAGAMTISELMLSATASILVPLPHAIDNHQFYNAKILADNNAGILIEQAQLSVELLEQTLLSITPAQIQQISANAFKLAKPNAADEIANYLLS